MNIIEIVPPLAPKSMLVDSTMFYVWEVQILNLLGDNITKINSSIIKNMTCFVEHENMTNYAMWFYVERCKAEKQCASRQEKHVPNRAQWEIFSVP